MDEAPGLQPAPVSAFVVDQQGYKGLFPESAFVQDDCSSPLPSLSMASLETFTSATTQLRDGEGSGQDHQDLTVLCLAPHAGLWSESGTGGSASWWGVGFLWSMAQVQIEFVFLFQPASSSHPPTAPPLKEERHFSLI